MKKRLAIDKVLEASDNFRVIYIDGARQCGKTTFVKQIAEQKNYTYITFDDDATMSLAENNLGLFFTNYPPPLIIDEVQKVPKIINKIKTFADNYPLNKGQFILTGSVDLLKSARIYESLAGRMAGYKLYPFSVFELENIDFNLVENLFLPDFYTGFAKLQSKNYEDIVNRLLIGGFPELQFMDEKFHKQWFANYFKARINKDIYDLTEDNLRKTDKMPALLRLLSGQTANLLNINNIAKKLQIAFDTTANYIHWIEAMFIIERLRPYEKNIGKQVKKMPKLYFTDTGFVKHLSKLSKEKLMKDTALFGHLLENYIYNEIQKHISFSKQSFEIYYFRDDKTNEVDFIIENEKEEIICIEIKSADHVAAKDLKGMQSFRNNFDKKIKAMYVFYGGDTISATSIGQNKYPVTLLPYNRIF